MYSDPAIQTTHLNTGSNEEYELQIPFRGKKKHETKRITEDANRHETRNPLIPHSHEATRD